MAAAGEGCLTGIRSSVSVARGTSASALLPRHTSDLIPAQQPRPGVSDLQSDRRMSGWHRRDEGMAERSEG